MRINPYLHVTADRIYNPLTDRALVPADADFASVRDLWSGGLEPADGGPMAAAPHLVDAGWAVRNGEDLSRRHLLKIVSLETLTTCNQKCYFCPVSIAPREDEEMPVALFEQIVEQLMPFRQTLEGVFLQSYNEPTIDRRFVDLVRTLFAADLPVAVLSNGSGLTPGKVDQLLEAGRLRYLCINLSTLDRQQYKDDRGADHLEAVLRNLDYLRDKPLADQMRIIVLGRGDEQHQADFERTRERFAGSRFEVESFLTIDRGAWHLEVGAKVTEPIRNLGGCELLGSRPIQHLHITPAGSCILCCQDYDENYVVGDLKAQSILEVLEGDAMATMRRWAYGVEEAPDDFICRNCAFAIRR